MNCLAYALRFWKAHPRYRLYYDGDHVINSAYELHGKEARRGWYQPIEACDRDYFARVFAELLDEEERVLLEEYFQFIS